MTVVNALMTGLDLTPTNYSVRLSSATCVLSEVDTGALESASAVCRCLSAT